MDKRISLKIFFILCIVLNCYELSLFKYLVNKLSTCSVDNLFNFIHPMKGSQKTVFHCRLEKYLVNVYLNMSGCFYFILYSSFNGAVFIFISMTVFRGFFKTIFWFPFIRTLPLLLLSFERLFCFSFLFVPLFLRTNACMCGCWICFV